MKEYKCKTPVLLIFFNRPDTFQHVFESVRSVKPPILYLVQDGARAGNEEDVENIRRCREIAEGIDWQCKLYKNYAERNMSCDSRVFSGISWAFETAERLIVLEDDCVPNISFFYFCDELLSRYETDERIHMISGTERFGQHPFCEDTYYFSYITAGLGWATWKRVWNDVEHYSDLSILDDAVGVKQLEIWTNNYSSGIYKNYIGELRKIQKKSQEAGKIISWEILMSLAQFLEGRLCIAPTKNLVAYIGNTPEATHGIANIELFPPKTRLLFKNIEKSYDLSIPIKHPQYVIRNIPCERIHKRSWTYNEIGRIWNKILLYFKKILKK